MGFIQYQLFQLKWQLIDLFFPPACGGCDQLGVRWCPQCQEKCKPFEINSDMREEIPGQRQELTPLKYAWTEYRGPVRNAIIKIKYQRDIGLAGILAAQLIKLFWTTGWSIDVVIPVPLGKKRKLDRGYNQAELIAKPFSIGIDHRYDRKALRRVRETKSQINLNFQQRRSNVKDAFLANPTRVNEKDILLIDDVTTSGATLDACARALYDQGCSGVYAITVAQTKLPMFQ